MKIPYLWPAFAASIGFVPLQTAAQAPPSGWKHPSQTVYKSDTLIAQMVVDALKNADTPVATKFHGKRNLQRFALLHQNDTTHIELPNKKSTLALADIIQTAEQKKSSQIILSIKNKHDYYAISFDHLKKLNDIDREMRDSLDLPFIPPILSAKDYIQAGAVSKKIRHTDINCKDSLSYSVDATLTTTGLIRRLSFRAVRWTSGHEAYHHLVTIKNLLPKNRPSKEVDIPFNYTQPEEYSADLSATDMTRDKQAAFETLGYILYDERNINPKKATWQKVLRALRRDKARVTKRKESHPSKLSRLQRIDMKTFSPQS